MSCGRTITIEVGCGNTLEVIIPTPEVFTVEITQGKKWIKGEVTIPAAVDTVTSPLFQYPLDIFMSLNGAPIDWEANGWVQDSSTTDGVTTYFLTIPEDYGEIQGTLKFKYYA
jgi:hypothetical protein